MRIFSQQDGVFDTEHWAIVEEKNAQA